MGKKHELSASGAERIISFKRARWKHFVRYFGVFVIVMLNISLVLSTMEIHRTHAMPDIKREILSFLLVGFFDLLVLIPTILEVDEVVATPEKVVLKTLFWTSKVPWGKLISFVNPVYLTCIILRTPRCLYLINKRDLKPIDELIETIEFKRARAGK